MTSSRTQYREKRQSLVINCISLLLLMLLLEKRELEQISTPFFKRLKKDLMDALKDKKSIQKFLYD